MRVLQSCFALICFSMASLLVSSGALALVPGERVDNFRLLDHEGESHELYYHSDASAVVFMVHGNGCPIVRNALPRYRELRDAYANKGVVFRLLNANLQDNRTSIAAEAAKFGIDIPILMDDTQLIGEALGLVRTAEVFVIDPKTWKVVYRGAMDDRLGYETQKVEANHHFLADTLDAMLDDETIVVASTDALGCLINLPEAGKREQHASISYTRDIAPLLIERCITCHREGGIGPWAMTDYNMVRGFAPMIREVVRTGRMPPWHADPAHGSFSNDRSLSKEQTQTLVHWIEAGAPRGDGPDPLAEFEHDWQEWALGEPDLVLDIPGYEVPATGVVDYQYQHVRNPHDRDVWVRAAEILPGDRAVLHHVITTFTTPGPDGKLDRRRSQSLGGYVPGAEADEFPEGTGTLLPAGAVFTFQMHYTTSGRASTDHSRLGIYFHDEQPEHRLGGAVLMNTKINIPAHSKDHEEYASRVLDADVLLYSLLPHAHFRGKASEFRAIYPDGTEEILLSVPNYDFNWQTTYVLSEPKLLSKGTKVVHATRWDNSAQNMANPDPTRDIPWGQQSWDEMLFGAISWRYVDDADR
ncbi:MAG: redoxin family protein, partial [Pseudomonadales bacterium]|nr:redoxin family protein [Pseudomonadales bacterium]